MSSAPSSIQSVLSELDEIIAWAEEHDSRIGWFAGAYRMVTRTIDGLLGKDIFDDDARMEHLDVVFATRYLQAFQQRDGGPALTPPWEAAFKACDDGELIIMQQVMSACLAHILFDLGVAVSDVAPGEEIESLSDDFSRLNDVFSVLGPTLLDRLGTLSKDIHRFNEIFGFIERPMNWLEAKILRTAGWHFAEKLAALTPAEREPVIAERGEQVSTWIGDVVSPPRLARPILHHIWKGEAHDVGTVTRALAAPTTVTVKGLTLQV